VREKNFPLVASMRAVISSFVGAFCMMFIWLVVGGERIVYFCGIVNKFFTLFRFFLRELCGTS
jgi:hypothetical protein